MLRVECHEGGSVQGYFSVVKISIRSGLFGEEQKARYGSLQGREGAKQVDVLQRYQLKDFKFLGEMLATALISY